LTSQSTIRGVERDGELWGEVMKDLAVGQVLGRYELLLPVAKGGMAQVWAARLRGTRGFQKIVAIKTILPGDLDDARMERMFLEEASLASQIHHPNVVGTLELGEDDGLLYLVMEWVEGESLNFIMRRAADSEEGMPLSVAVNLIGQACKGLHAAHDLRDESGALLGVVHRDISAQNVLVTYSGTAKIVDFGIAKVTARSSALTEAGEIKGKFAYLAPEQALAQPVDRRTDIFGMGILLYYLTTGRHPFRGTTPGETLRNICSTSPAKRPSEIVPGYPPELERVVEKALQKSPADRWATAHDMLAALERAMPQCLDGSFEVQIAGYMTKLLGNRSRERRTELRLAQQMLDGVRGDLPHDHLTGSSGSLRAIAVERGDAKSAEDSQSRRKTAVEIRLGGPPVVHPPRPAPFVTRSRVAFAGAAVAGVLALVLARPSARGPIDAASPATSPVPAAAVAPAETRSDPVAKIAPPSPAPATAQAPAAPAAEETKENTSSKRGAKKAAPPSRPAPPAVTPANSAPPAPERPRQEARDGSSNAWDPGSFGGRR
jgi:serine/threonine-protein kinase